MHLKQSVCQRGKEEDAEEETVESGELRGEATKRWNPVEERRLPFDPDAATQHRHASKNLENVQPAGAVPDFLLHSRYE